MQTRVGPLIPPIFVIIDIPTRPEDIAKRHHNKIVREALIRVAERHHKKHVPDHFKATNRQRYNHAPRSEKYKRYKIKRYGSRTDLVKSGQTKDWMTRSYQIRISGNAAAGTSRAILILKFPFKGGTGRFRDPKNNKAAAAQRTIKQMIGEIETFAEDERGRIAEWFLEEYMAGVEQFRGGRKRRRIPIT